MLELSRSLISDQALVMGHDLPTRSAILKLIHAGSATCASFYLNMNALGSASNAALALKENYYRVRYSLRQRGFARDDIESWLKPVRHHWENASLLQEYQHGIAIFLAEDWGTVLNLQGEMPFHTCSWLSNQFYLKPLLPLINDGGSLYILQLDRNHLQMKRKGIRSMERVRVPGMPESLYVGAEQSRSAMLELNGLEMSQEGGMLKRRVTDVAHAVADFFEGYDATLAIIGRQEDVDSLCREEPLKDVRTISDGGLAPEMSDLELWQLCQRFAQSIADKNLARHIDELLQTPKRDLLTAPASVAKAALEGEIDLSIGCLEDDYIVQLDEQTHQFQTDAVASETANAYDLVDLIFQETIRHGGEAYVAHRKQLPNGVACLAHHN